MTEKELQEAVEVAKKQVMLKIEDELPFVFAENGLQKLVSKLGNGELHITLRVYNGFVTDLVNTTMVERSTFKRKP